MVPAVLPHAVLLAALLSPAPSSGPSSATNEETALSALARDLGAAIARGDVDGYLALVDTRDPEFALEHRRFAQDWRARPPRGVTFAVSGLRLRGDEADGRVRLAWTTSAGEARDAEFDAVFRKVSGAWRYGGERLTAVEGPGGVRVLAAPGQEEAARVLAQNLGDVTALVTRTLGFAPPAWPSVKAYGGGRPLSASVALSLQPVAGWNEPGEAIKLASPRWPAARSTLAHELTHSAVFARLGAGEKRVPWWLHEGLAQFVASGTWSESERASYLDRARGWARRGELQPWSAIAHCEATPDERWPWVYAQGYAFVRFVVETRGMAALDAYMRRLAAGESADAAGAAALGKPFGTLDADFRRWLVPDGA